MRYAVRIRCMALLTAVGAVGSCTGGTMESTPTVRLRPTSCAPVEFETGASVAGVKMLIARATSDAAGTGHEIAAGLFLERGGTVGDRIPNEPVEGRVRTSVNGHAALVYPAASGGPGPHVMFVFPPNGSTADGCNVWSLASQDPDLSATALADIASALRFSES